MKKHLELPLILKGVISTVLLSAGVSEVLLGYLDPPHCAGHLIHFRGHRCSRRCFLAHFRLFVAHFPGVKSL